MIQIGIVEALIFIALGIGAIAGSRLAFWCLERFIVFDQRPHPHEGHHSLFKSIFHGSTGSQSEIEPHSKPVESLGHKA